MQNTTQKAQASYKKYLQWCKKNKLKANRCESLELYFAEVKEQSKEVLSC